MSIRNIRKKAALAAGFPPDCVSGVSSLTLAGGCELVLYGCRSVGEYTSERITVIMCDTRVTVSGECLRLRTFFGDRMCITGRMIYGVALGGKRPPEGC
ncbi:MAG: YabP/YqfC family sporulation protein [Clostridia bacterium]|nr:YabP/YqfC family sporulation protein [Clostridia bacterium]